MYTSFNLPHIRSASSTFYNKLDNALFLALILHIFFLTENHKENRKYKLDWSHKYVVHIKLISPMLQIFNHVLLLFQIFNFKFNASSDCSTVTTKKIRSIPLVHFPSLQHLHIPNECFFKMIPTQNSASGQFPMTSSKSLSPNVSLDCIYAIMVDQINTRQIFFQHSYNLD